MAAHKHVEIIGRDVERRGVVCHGVMPGVVAVEVADKLVDDVPWLADLRVWSFLRGVFLRYGCEDGEAVGCLPSEYRPGELHRGVCGDPAEDVKPAGDNADLLF